MRLSRAAVVGATVLVVAGGGYAAYAENSGPATSYRTAVVTKGDVAQTLALSGTLSPAGRSDLSFTTSGTVAKVGVSVGQEVKAGQVVARLDRTSLLAAVTRARAQLDAARARLVSDEDAQASAAASASSTSSPIATSTKKPTKTPSSRPSPSSQSSGSSGSAGSNAAASALLSQIKQQQTDVTTSQTAASAALAAAKAALVAEQTSCAEGSSSASPTATATATDSASASDSTGATPASGSACDDAIDAVQTAQTKVDTAQTQLQQALETLATTLTAASAPQGSTQGSAPSSSPSGAVGGKTTSSGTTASPSSSGSATSAGPDTAATAGAAGAAGGGRTVTAATLASDQATIDSARAGLITAEQSFAGAVLRAPHAGTVGELDVAAGSSASAGSTAVVVLSPGATDVDLTVTAAQVAQLKVGQVTEVTPAGATESLPGKVARITPVPDSSGDYPVTVTLDQDGLDLPAGGAAAVDIVVAQAEGVLTVPTSAVESGFVEVLEGATVTRTRVVVGVVGSTRTQISSGLKGGQQVVLADLSTAVPASTTSNPRRFGGAGGFGGIGGLTGGGTFSGNVTGGFVGGGPPGGFGG